MNLTPMTPAAVPTARSRGRQRCFAVTDHTTTSIITAKKPTSPTMTRAADVTYRRRRTDAGSMRSSTSRRS
jgi:hypothetical protein